MMGALLKFLSLVGLLLTVGPAFMVLTGDATWAQHARWMGVGTLLWFSTAPFWMRVRQPGAAHPASSTPE